MNQPPKKPKTSKGIFMIGIFVIVFFLIIAFFYYNTVKDFKVLVDEIQPLYNNYTKKISSEMIPPPNGLKMSYILWLYIDNNPENSQWFSNFSGDKIIMDKGNSPNIVYLPYNNSIKILVKIKDLRQPENIQDPNNAYRAIPNNIDFKEKVQEIEIQDIKFQQWTQLAVVMDNRYVDVYLNAVLVKSSLLDNVPILNHNEITLGKAKHNPNLYLGKLEYKPDTMPMSEINALYLRDKGSFTIDGNIKRNVGLDTMKIRRQEYKDRMLQDEELTMDETDPL